MRTSLGEDSYTNTEVPANWPDHLEAAVRSLNNRILPNLKYSPNELLLGLVINTNATPSGEVSAIPTPEEVETQMAYVDQQRFDGYSQIVEHAQRRKAAFDKRVISRPPREVIFKAGDLVQVYRSDLDFTLAADRKLLPKFSAPRRIVSRNRNSYQLETLEGFPIAGKFSSRRLRQFIPRQGTELERTQSAIEGEWQRREEEKDDENGTKEDLNLGIDEQTPNKEATSDIGGEHLESSQPLGTSSVDTSSRGSHSHATRTLLSPGGVHVVVDIPKDAPIPQSDQVDN